jgi:hypothetical protein
VGGAYLTPEQVEALRRAVNNVNEAQLAIVDRLSRQHKTPQGDTLDLFALLARLREVLTPALTQANEEEMEAGRDPR